MSLEASIAELWERRDSLSPDLPEADLEPIEAALDLIDRGEQRIAERQPDGTWTVNEWLKQAVSLGFLISRNRLISGGPNATSWFDRIESKFAGWGSDEWTESGFRAVPSAIVRRPAYVAPGAVLMPSFVNVGAYVGENTMIDTWATVGSCAQIGANVHLSGGTGIGGVMEPLQATPTIIEDDCFIGARSEVAEGVIVRQGSVLAMGSFVSQSTKIVDRETGDISYGEIPPYSVVVPGSLPSSGGVNLNCAVIVKRVDARTRAKTGINELLRG